MKTPKQKHFLIGLILMCLTSASFGQNYAEVLQKSMFFYEAQRAGELPENNRVNWRGNSVMKDGSDVGADLSKGWFDAGDLVKFNFPMAWSVTTLSWGALEYTEGYTETGQWDYLLDNIKWVTDYFINCHPEPNTYYYQVGDGTADHSKWTAAEIIEDIMDRPTSVVNPSTPGSDVAAETAAAMASASMLFKSSDPAYSAELLQHAKELYKFAEDYPGSYPLDEFYKSWNGYKDEMVWGAIWLYKATGDAAYLAKAEAGYGDLGKEMNTTTPVYKHTFSWDDKAYACYVLLAQLTGKEIYKTDAERWLDHWTYNIEKTPAGLPYQKDNGWGVLRYASNTALCALVYSDLLSEGTKKQDYYNMAKFIGDYSIGDNPENMSYVVGYGSDWPKHIHHRTAHGWHTGFPSGDVPDNRHILYGALAGGPDFDDIYIDDINKYQYTEVACDYNAAFSGVMARLAMDNNHQPIANFPIPEVPEKEYIVEVKLAESTENKIQLVGWIINSSAWPARITEKQAFRYYIDITEGVEAGYTAADYQVGGASSVTDLIPWDEANNIYYAEYVKEYRLYPGGTGESQQYISIDISLPGAPASAWDPENDWSFQGVASTTEILYNAYMPGYENGVYLSGLEPGSDGNSRPAAVLTTDVTSGFAPLTVAFSASGSSDPDGDAITYAWNFGDGVTASGINKSHTFTTAGSYNATLTVSDGTLSNSKSVTITVSEEDVAVTGVTMSQTSATLADGATLDLNATVAPANATNKSVSWTSSNTSVATVNSSGLVSAVSAGSATITVTTADGNKTATCVITVTATSIPVTSVSISQTSATLEDGETIDLNETILPANATNKSVSWTSSNTSVATVNSTGLVTAVSAGSATITVTTADGNKTASCAITVTDAPPTGITIEYVDTEQSPNVAENLFDGNPDDDSRWSAKEFPKTVIIDYGETKSITGTRLWTYQNRSYHYTVEISNSPSSGFVQVVDQSGSTSSQPIEHSFAATSGRYVKITVTAATGYSSNWVSLTEFEIVEGGSTVIPVTGVSLSQSSITIEAGQTSQLTATVAPANATNQSVSYGSSNTSVATVNSSGLVTAVGAGSATITVTTDDGNKIATCAVTVPSSSVPVTSVALSQSSASLLQGNTLDLNATVSPSNATNQSVSWSSSNTSVATVNNSGLVSAISAGSATITVTTVDGNKTANCAVTVTGGGGGTGCDFEPMASALPTINTSYDNIYVTGSGPDLSKIRKFSINWDLANNGLYVFAFNTSNGVPNWYVPMKALATHTFGSSQPEVSVSGSGITGFDGDYYAIMDGDNFVLAEKSGAYTIYFSNVAAPDCDDFKSTEAVESELSSISIYPNPVSQQFLYMTGLSENNAQVMVTDMLGKTLLVENVNSDVNGIDVSMLNTGTYILIVKGDKGHTSKLFNKF